MPQPDRAIPDTYRLLAVFNGTPIQPEAALIAAGLRQHPTNPHAPTPISDAHRALLRELHVHRRCIRWERRGPNGPGYVLTPAGTDLLDTYYELHGPLHTPRRGPPLADIARQHLPQPQDVTP